MDELLIREAGEQDVNVIAELEQMCFSTPWSERSIHDEIAENELAYYLVAEHAERIVGYAGLWLVADEGHITNIAVHPEYRRRGIASSLVTALLNLPAGIIPVAYTLEVRASNTSAIALYHKFGFRNCGVRRAYYEDNNEDALIMWKR